jgi:2,4-diketo-3-deoxy-L-fuconate hydrolase
MGKFICIGLNYADHAAESGMPMPAEPVVFTKHTSASCRLQRPGGAAAGLHQDRLGSGAGRGHRQQGALCEQKPTRWRMWPATAWSTTCEREYQIERGGTWDKGKGCDTFGPIGPWLVTADEVPDPQNGWPCGWR